MKAAAAPSAETVRRSTRRTKKQSYSVGDVVEVEYGGTIAFVRLLARASDENAMSPRWKTALMAAATAEGGADAVDPVLEESSFGDVVGRASPDGPQKGPRGRVGGSGGGGSGGKRKESPVPLAGVTAGAAQAVEAPAAAPPAGKKPRGGGGGSDADNASSHSHSTAAPSDSGRSAGRASAREERVRRRQAQVPLGNHSGGGSSSHGAATGGAVAKKPKKPPVPVAPHPHGSSHCIKVPMLTGTLYLYHGLARRAEFVRKV